jgi:predicted DCC family thiol-disulfide oxidoreductase YuxK
MVAPSDLTVVFFDGYCGLCNHFVDFLIARDRNRVLRYAPLQSPLFEEITRRFPEVAGKDTLVTYQRRGGKEHVFLFSDASLTALAALPGAWAWLRWLRVFPLALRNAVYAFVARVRYRILGKRTTCRLPKPEERVLFIEQLPE